MIRLFIYAVIAYFLWKIVSAFSHQRRYRKEDVPETKAPKAVTPDFSTIKDAEFEELPPADPDPPRP